MLLRQKKDTNLNNLYYFSNDSQQPGISFRVFWENSQGFLSDKIDQAIDTLRRHPYIAKAADFKSRFGALVKRYIDATYIRFKTNDINEAFNHYQNGHYGAALLKLRRIHGVTGEGSSELEKTLDTVTTYGEKFLPQTAMEKLKELCSEADR